MPFRGVDALTKRLVRPCALFVIQLVDVHGLQVHDLTLGQLRERVEHETPVVNQGLEWLHRSRV
jgi:hypothetical protein